MFRRLSLALWLSIAAILPAHATSVLPLYLDEIIDQSTTAFEGTCVSNRTGRDPQTGMLVTLTTFTVDDVLKGDVSATHTIKQVGGRDSETGLNFKVQGVPTFVVGEKYVLFLAGTSQAGFSSPIGLSQGRFAVTDGAAGPEVTNGNDFKELTARMAALPPAAKAKIAQPGALTRLPLDEFKGLVRQHKAVAK